MVRFESVSLSYRRHGPRSRPRWTCLRDVNFDLAEGSFRWLLGASGSGKTTLLRLMNMSLRPTRGEVIVLGCARPARYAAMHAAAAPADRRHLSGFPSAAAPFGV